LSGNALINGNVTAASISTNGQAVINGHVTKSAGTLNCFPMDLAVFKQLLTASNDNASIPARFLSGNDLNVAGKSALSLPAGDYIFDNVNVSGGADVIAQGPVHIFVRQAVSFTGHSMVSKSGAPPIIIFTDSASGQQLSGGDRFAGVIYAPNAQVSVSGNTQLIGRVQATSINVAGNASVAAP